MKKVFILILVAFVGFRFVLAEPFEEEVDPIDLALGMVLQNDYKLRSLFYQEMAKHYQIEQARSGFRPQISISSYLGWQRYKSYYGSETDQTLKYFYIAFIQPLYKPEVSKKVKQSQYYKEIATLRRILEEQSIKYTFFSTYIDYLTNVEKLKLQKKINSLLKKKYRLIKKLYSLKKTTKPVLLNTESEYLNSYINLKNISYDVKAREEMLSLLIGDKKYVDLLKNYRVNPSFQNINYDYDYWETELKNNLEIKEATLNIKAAKEEINIRKYQRYPKVNLELSYRYSSTSAISIASDDKRIALTLDFPLYQGGYVKNSVLEAKELEKAALMDLKSIENQKKQELKDAWMKMIKAKKNINMLKNQLNTEIKLLKIIKIGRKKGVFTEIDVIDQQVKVLRVKQNIVSEIDNFILAYLNVLFLTSKLDEKGVKSIKMFIKKR